MRSAARISSSLRHGDELPALCVVSYTNVEKNKFARKANQIPTVLLQLRQLTLVHPLALVLYNLMFLQ
jgi:hypothetical protein